jgi:hypothetical protein
MRYFARITKGGDAMTQPGEEQPKQPLEDPELGPKGPRTPYPVDEPIDPKGTGSEPDYFPGKPGGDLPKLRAMSGRGQARAGHPRLFVSRQQAH